MLAQSQNHKSKIDAIKLAATEAAKVAQNEAKLASKPASAADGDSSKGSLDRELEAAIGSLKAGLVERDTEVRLMLLAALSGEHILFIGPPGTAKSELGRRLASLCKGGTFFERLLTRFTVPEELFGPLSMRALEKDEYERKTKGYLPKASVAFVDEIFKANSAILNTLLTILNERLFDNGDQRTEIPLLCMVGASNELPESEELDALYDRFLLRKQVGQVSSSGLKELLADTRDLEFRPGGQPDSLQVDISDEKFKSIRRKAKNTVEVSDDVNELIIGVRTYLQETCEPPCYVSDRRLLKAVDMLKVAAYTSGRSSVSLYDCLLLQHVLWKTPDQSERVADYITRQIAQNEKGLEQTDYLFSDFYKRACKLAGSGVVNKEDEQKTAELERTKTDLLGDTQALRDTLIDKLASIYAIGQDGSAGIRSIWISEEDGEAVMTAVSSKLGQSQEGIEKLLFEVVTLQVAMQEDQPDVTHLADMLQNRWAHYIRNSSTDEAKPYGTRAQQRSMPRRFGSP